MEELGAGFANSSSRALCFKSNLCELTISPKDSDLARTGRGNSPGLEDCISWPFQIETSSGGVWFLSFSEGTGACCPFKFFSSIRRNMSNNDLGFRPETPGDPIPDLAPVHAQRNLWERGITLLQPKWCWKE